MKRILFIAVLLLSVSVKAQLTTYHDGVIPVANNPTHLAPRYSYVREADMMWAKRIWRVVDFREKINQYFLFPLTENNNRINLMDVIMKGIQEGKIQPFDPWQGDDFKVKMSSEDALKLGTWVDTIPIWDPNPPYEIIGYEPVYEPFDPFQVRKIKIKEDWFFDTKRSVMEVRIVGICPVLEVLDHTTKEPIGEMDMYWINYEEAREYFATYKIYNPYNFAQRISYDDAFNKRIFSSLIYKQDNTQDRRIAEYQQGMDALLEAEDIKNDIFIFEHDLWEQ